MPTYKALNTNTLCLQNESHLPGAEQLGDVTCVFIGDEAFPLHEHFMKRGCTDDQRVFNCRLSRARYVESDLCVLSTRSRVTTRKPCRGPAKNRCSWVTASSRYSGQL